MVKIQYTQARKPHIKGPLVFAEEGYRFKIDLGETAEVDQELSRLLLSKYGDIIKEVKGKEIKEDAVMPPATRMVDSAKIKTK